MVIPLTTYTITVNAFEAGILMGMIEAEKDGIHLAGVRRQLIAMKNNIEKVDGVVKKILPNGLLEITDEDGNRIIRPPYSWEVEGN